MKTVSKKIAFLTSTRADFGKLVPLIQQVDKSPEFEAYIFATGMHTLSRYGSTVKEIYKLGFSNIYPYINQDGSVNSQMDIVLANTIHGLSLYLREFPPDLMVVHGDRLEALAGAIVGAFHNIRVAHIEGGEVSGTIDETIRHAVSKLSHLHFIANEEAGKRLIQMGELKDAIFRIGSPDIDVMLSNSLPSLPEVMERYEISYRQYSIFIYHPVTTELHLLRQHIATVIDALEASRENFIMIYPNNDTGSEIILEAFKRLYNNPCFRILSSLRFDHFLTLLKNANAIVGNSSTGIRESPVYSVPSLNIGNRQNRRFQSPSILNIPEDKEVILHALRNIPRDLKASLHFGRGNSAALFMEALRNPLLWNVPIQKEFQDLQS